MKTCGDVDNLHSGRKKTAVSFLFRAERKLGGPESPRKKFHHPN
jgi:hypothetical protein